MKKFSGSRMEILVLIISFVFMACGYRNDGPANVANNQFQTKIKKSMISTKDLSALPDRKMLQKVCKAIAVLDAIIAPDWQDRYYLYNAHWAENEEFFEMRNGQGDNMMVLFRNDGCVINGLAHEYGVPPELQDKYRDEKLTHGLPAQFHAFIFGEPVKSTGTTFCVWTTESQNWKTGKVETYHDGSEEYMKIFDGNPQTYLDWATDYYNGYVEGPGDYYKSSGIPLETVRAIYDGTSLTKEMVLAVVEKKTNEQWLQLETDLQEIGYPYDFK